VSPTSPSGRHVWPVFAIVVAAALLAGLAGFQIGRKNQPPAAAAPRAAEAAAGAPLIGIASLDSEPYVRAIRDSGGVPVVLPNTDGDTQRIEEYLQRLDGLLLPGGADIPPSEYGEEAHESVRLLSDERFRFEKALTTAWIERTNKPLLGICLGSQWINVASGGSLVQDIPSTVGSNHRGVNHPVTLTPDSKLSAIFGTTELEVNSLHHQSVKDVGRHLRVVARAPDGVVEATESTDPNRFLIGVQWHPEKLMPDNTQQARLIKAFIEAAKEKRNTGDHPRALP
jgi:putative glutamine amidotransferase